MHGKCKPVKFLESFIPDMPFLADFCPFCMTGFCMSGAVTPCLRILAFHSRGHGVEWKKTKGADLC